MAIVDTAARTGPEWPRRVLVGSGILVAVLAVVAVARLPVADSAVWLEAGVVAASAVLLAATAWWLTGRPASTDRRVVLLWGLTARTGRWRSGLRAGVWSGVGSGLGASLGGAALLAFLRSNVERDPLMVSEWRQRASDMDLATYVTRETMAGVGGHLWVLGVAQGAVVGLVAATLGLAVARLRATAARSGAAQRAR